MIELQVIYMNLYLFTKSLSFLLNKVSCLNVMKELVNFIRKIMFVRCIVKA